jgi:predicted Zn-dependent peptidase
VAVMINAGVRDEPEGLHGIAHFTEHMLFKGTGKKNTRQIISYLEEVGGEIDAFTTKEDTVLYAAVPVKYFERALALFSEIVYESTFPVKELEKEREVILDEINSYKDNPAEQIFEEFESLVFSGHPLARNILGTPKNLKVISQTELVNFTDRHYIPSNIVLCSMGAVPADTLNTLAEKYFGRKVSQESPAERKIFSGYSPRMAEKKKKSHQTHCIIGTEAYGYNDRRRIPFSLLVNILGGPAMLSRLNMLLREKHGLVYNVEASSAMYSDTGLFTIYFGTDAKNYSKAYGLIMKELEGITEKKMSYSQLEMAKKQYTGQLLLSLENPEPVMMAMGKSLLSNHKKLTRKSMMSQIEEITPEDILDSAQILRSANLSLLLYK